ncbi:hypothetical protein ACRALDRAFT_2045118 [Sodiomyces alcalophilus JCM 7366]|uniref:uncharacterized protein n=1 Tax=Sodiomyces alcalophilus JCM 7366 TaxID=591952 RepID=UPI0039B4CA14
MKLLREHQLALAGILAVLTLSLRLSRPRDPWYTRWTDIVLRYNIFYGQRGQYVHQLHEKYGPVVRIGPNQVDINDINAFKTIYSTREVFVKSEWYRVLTGHAVNDSLFATTDPDVHRRLRRLLSAPLSEAALASSHDLFQRKAKMAVRRMREAMDEKGVADVYMWWMFMATDIIGELTFGKSFDMLAKSERDQYAIDVQGISHTTAVYTTFAPLDRLFRFLPIPLMQRAYRAIQNLGFHAAESVARYKSLTREDDPEKVYHDDTPSDAEYQPKLFEKVFAAEKEGTMSAKEIRENAQGYIVAGTDTTAVTLTYLVWAVCRAPARVRKALLDEMAAMAGDDDDYEPSLEDLKGAKYLNCVVDEALRLYGAAQTGLPKVVPRGGAVLAGYALDAGTTVEAQSYSLHRDERVFADPDTFEPGRWEDASREMRAQLVAFGGGARACIGIHLAKMELRLGAFHFFRAFPGAEAAAPDDEMSMKTFFVLAPKAGRCLVRAR